MFMHSAYMLNFDALVDGMVFWRHKFGQESEPKGVRMSY